MKKLIKELATYSKRLTGKHYIILALLLLALLFFFNNIKAIIAVGILGVLASYSKFYQRYIKVPGVVELLMFSTVMTSIAYGPVVGAVFGIMASIAADIIGSDIDLFSFVDAFGRGVIGILAFNFYSPEGSIVALGLIMTLIFYAISLPIYLFLGDLELKLKAVVYIPLNLGFNFVIFSSLGNLLLKVLV